MWHLHINDKLSRRRFLRVSTAGAAACSMSGWLSTLAARAAEVGPRSKRCILLWMTGGPSHIDTFDLKPDAPLDVRGEFKPIATSVPGIQISEHFPQFSQLMRHAAIIRGMSTVESEHMLATYHMHTGYQKRGGDLVFPAIGALAWKELVRDGFPLPGCVVIGPAVREGTGSGILGPQYQPLDVRDPGRGVENIRPLVDDARFDRQLGLLRQLEQSFYKSHQAPASAAHATVLDSSVQLMRAKELRAFDLSAETAATRNAYTSTPFGQGCLLARRLVEVGVPFVEVNMNPTSWDTHQQNFPRTRTLSLQVDAVMSALITDLRERGLLDDILVIWMGEFGRTPKVTSGGGRNHHARAWSTVLIGGGIRGGQVIGKTDAQAATVVERPVSVVDFLATICKVLGIDYTKEYRPPGVRRPIGIVDNGKEVHPLDELFG
ncbi:MAG: DUF1501 domain-containing protein [Gemmataceae bacterium]